MRKTKLVTIMSVLFALMMIVAGCTPAATPQIVEKQVVVEKPVIQTVVVEKEVQVEKQVVQTVVVEKQVVVEPTAVPARQAKYVFLFIGDGMAVAQRNAAELFKAATESAGARPEDTRLIMNTFPAQGMNTTYDLTSVIPDSASTATALASGFKTASGVVGMNTDGTVSYQNIAEVAKAAGWKVGVISSVSIDHATPASFYAHQASRSKYYEISMQLANSDFDLFAGGPPLQPTGKSKDQADVFAAAEANGFTIVRGKAAWEALAPGAGKIWAMPDYFADSNAFYYDMDRPTDDVSLAGYVSKSIKLLDNDAGFFIVVEGGKIDWACHANDAAASIHDTIALDNAIAEAYEFYMAHPDETLIIVTGDHETGGMSIGFAGTGYSSFVDKIAQQKISQVVFSGQIAKWRQAGNTTFEDTLPFLAENFGLIVLTEEQQADLQAKSDAGDKDAKLKLSMALSELELELLQEGFTNSMLGKEERPADQQTYLLYGGYEPYAIKVTHVLNQKAGISWTSYSHTGIPVQTSAIGVGAEMFNGYYDQTDINVKMMTIAGLQYTRKVASSK